MKEVHSKDLVVGKVYADINSKNYMSLLRYIGKGFSGDKFIRVAGANPYPTDHMGRVIFSTNINPFYYEPTDEIMELFGLEHKMAKNKRVCN